MLFILILELEPSSYKNIIIFLFYFFCGWTGRLLGWTVSNHKKKRSWKLKTWNSETWLVKSCWRKFPKWVSRKKNTRSAELETGNSIGNLVKNPPNRVSLQLRKRVGSTSIVPVKTRRVPLYFCENRDCV